MTALDRERRLVTVQFGDYAEAVRRQQAGEAETYYAQTYTVDFMARVAEDVPVTVVTCAEEQALERQPNGVATAGIELYPPSARARHRALVALVERLQPTHLVLETPNLALLQWAARADVDVLPLFFDSFCAGSLRERVRHRRLARALNDARVRWVGNHGLSAARDLVRIGVDPAKVLPFDWPALVVPDQMPAWRPSAQDRPHRALYVGTLSEVKGVGDALRALGALRDAPRRHELTLIGAGEERALRELARTLRIEDRVTFLGRTSHDEVLNQMHAHDCVLVPSRHEYPEGLPMTIYEALCSKAPLVVSDHPMFASKVRDGHNALVFPAGNAAALADHIRALAGAPDLALSLSRQGAADAIEFFLPLKWHRLIEHWLAAAPADDAALAAHALESRAGAMAPAGR